MITFRKAEKNDLSTIASFIEQQNQISESHIGFCGLAKEEIENALIEDLTDMPFTETFVLTYNKGKLIGIMGFDYDASRAVAEIWGPFVEADYCNTLNDAWRFLKNLFPKTLLRADFFPNAKHSVALDWLKNLNTEFISEQLTLSIDKKAVEALENSDVSSLSPVYEKPMTLLHDFAFPNTYYSGNEILERLNERQRVFIHTIEDKLSGYIYVEANPEFGEGSIEFFAVDPIFRGQGIGEKLIIHALKFIFSFAGTQSVQLCVSASNPTAIHLYEKVGFKRTHALRYFTQSMV